MSESDALPVNHHADHPGFAGVPGALFGLIFLLIGRSNARLAVDLAEVAENDRAIDIGCGPGVAVRYAARRGAQATGVDPSSTLLRIARAVTRRGPDVRWIKGTAENLPVADGAATVAWSIATVHHWTAVGSGLSETHRVLAPGARFVAIERQTVAGATGVASHGWTAQQVESFAAQCRNAGFAEVDIGSQGNGRRAVWTVSCTRP